MQCSHICLFGYHQHCQHIIITINFIIVIVIINVYHFYFCWHYCLSYSRCELNHTWKITHVLIISVWWRQQINLRYTPHWLLCPGRWRHLIKLGIHRRRPAHPASPMMSCISGLAMSTLLGRGNASWRPRYHTGSPGRLLKLPAGWWAIWCPLSKSIDIWEGNNVTSKAGLLAKMIILHVMLSMKSKTYILVNSGSFELISSLFVDFSKYCPMFPWSIAWRLLKVLPHVSLNHRTSAPQSVVPCAPEP